MSHREYNASGAEIKSYGYKPDSTWTTDPLFMKEAGAYYFYKNDHLATPQKMTAINGGVVWSAKYESFGKAQVDSSSTVTNNLRFPGQYYDHETGLHYNRYRYYDPVTGRYLRSDPLGLHGGTNHFYTYTNNNPLNYADSKGLWTYKGYCRYISGGVLVGVGLLRCNVWTECRRDDTREIGEVLAWFFGGTVGEVAGVIYFNIAQSSVGTSTDSPTLKELEGKASIVSVTLAIGPEPLTASWTKLRLGNTYGEYSGKIPLGFDASGDIFWGWSDLTKSRPECCTF